MRTKPFFQRAKTSRFEDATPKVWHQNFDYMPGSHRCTIAGMVLKIHQS